MAESFPSEREKDLEAVQPESEQEAVEKPSNDPDNASSNSDNGSTFSESRHIEGPISPGLSRTSSRRLERINTTASSALSTIRSRAPRKPFTHPLTHEKTNADAIVDFDGPDDPYRPLNWAFRKKIITTALYGLFTMTATFSSSIFSSATFAVAEEFDVGEEVGLLGTALFLFGFGVGPCVWAPLSELYGRKPAVIIPVFISGIFAFSVGAGKDIQTVLICRFWQGVFGSAPVTNTGGVLGDLWSPAQRGAAIVGYSMAVVGGPTIGPLVGSAIVTSQLGWRWTQYISGIFIEFVVVLGVIFLDESYPAALLVTKARRLRHESGNWALHAKHEEWDVSLKEMAHKYLLRPFVLLTTPICFLVALYASFCYGILYALLISLSIVFQEIRGWTQVESSLPFLALLIGLLFGAAVNLANQRFYLKRMKANNGRAVPEARLPPMMLGAPIFAAGLFIFAWTAQPDIIWVAPCIGIIMTGFGFFTIFQAAINYLIDTFQKYSASAVAANSFLRSAFAGAFPLFISQELNAIGVGWGVSVFAFFACLLIPIPYLFYIYGKRIRARGAWSRESTL